MAQRYEAPSRAPKDYKRSDERIGEEIADRLAQDDYIDAREVELHVKEGCVTLEGVVPERHMKHAIEDIAAGCWGVHDVKNRIRVPRREVFGIGM